MSVESNVSEIDYSEHSQTSPETEKLQETHDEDVNEEDGKEEEEKEDAAEGNKEVEEKEEDEEEAEEESEDEDTHNVCEIEEQHFNQLYLAVDRCDTKAVRRLLMSSEDVNILDPNKTTSSQLNSTVKGLLHKTCINTFDQTSLCMTSVNDDNSSIVQTFLDNHDKKPAAEHEFHHADKNDHLDVLDVFQVQGDSAALADNETPLHVAVQERNTRVVDIILKHIYVISDKLAKGDEKFKKDYKKLVETRGDTPIELVKSDGRRVFAGVVWADKWTPLEILRKSDAYAALELAIESTQPKMVKILLRVNRYEYSEQQLGNSFRLLISTVKPWNNRREDISKMKRRNIIDAMVVLCYDIQHRMKCKNIKDIAHALVNSGNFNVKHQDDQLNTLIHNVVKQCENSCYNYLIKKFRWHQLQIQTMNDVVQLLLKKGADFNLKNTFGETPLIIAAEKGCCHIIQTLFDWEQKSGIKLDLDARDQYGATALIKAAEKNHVAVVRLLLNHKVSVNLHDYCGFTALHAAVYEANRSWFDLHFFCEELLERKFHYLDDDFEISRCCLPTWGRQIVDPYRTIEQLEIYLARDKKITRFKEEMVKLLLATAEINVNAIDFKGNTPLDLAVKSSQRITSETFQALKTCGAIRKLTKLRDKTPIHVARLDERGRSPLHRLIISQISNYSVEDMKSPTREQYHRRFYLMIRGILLTPDNFRKSATATDDKGRTALHYAVMQSSDIYDAEDRDLLDVLLKIGSNVNAADMHGKTSLHYAIMEYCYTRLVQCGADESAKDKNGNTPRDIRRLRELVTINTDNAKKLQFGEKKLYTCSNIPRDKILVETIRIYSQSARPKDSSEEAIWKIWIKNDFLRLNTRLSQFRPSIQNLIERLADCIKERDPRFECQPILVGSANEETKVILSADFDFNFRLVKFSQICNVFPHPLGPEGYFQLRRKRDNTERRHTDDGAFACFFNLDQCLLTNEVNSKFQITLEDVLHDPIFWQVEHLFEWNVTDNNKNILDNKSEKSPAGLCETVRLRMIHPIADGEGGFLFANVSIDVAACVHLKDMWLGDELPFAINPSLKAEGCTLVFDRPSLELLKPGARSIFSDTFARISFAPLESRIIRESSSLIKSAYMVCKLILYDHPRTTYQMKTSLLFCMEAFNKQKGCEKRDEGKFTKMELAFWVERLMFCFMQFCCHDFYPCYFMSSLRQRMRYLLLSIIYDYEELIEADNVGLYSGPKIPLYYSTAIDIYLDLCPNDAVIDIPLILKEFMNSINEGHYIATQDPTWELFDREEFIAKLSSRSSS